VVLDADIPFTERLDEGWDENGGTNPKSNAAQALGLAYIAGFMHPVDGTQTAIFADDQPIDNFFYYPNDDFQLPVVRAGEYIGYFDQAKFGFEIVLERLGYEPEISLARSLENLIAVESFTRANPEPDDADYFMHWHEKEACINYIDPCAYFGSFCGSKVYYKTGPGSGTSDRTKCNTPQEIYDGILKYFENRHKVYIDIKNDYNFSLNYFKNYGFNIQFQKPDDDKAQTELATNYNGWPIAAIKFADISTAGSPKRKNFQTSIRFPIGENYEPIIYTGKSNIKRFKKKENTKKIQSLKPNSLTEKLSKPFSISMLLIDASNIETFISNYHFIQYSSQNPAQRVNSSPLFPKSNTEFDHIFTFPVKSLSRTRFNNINLIPFFSNVRILPTDKKPKASHQAIMISMSSICFFRDINSTKQNSLNQMRNASLIFAKYNPVEFAYNSNFLKKRYSFNSQALEIDNKPAQLIRALNKNNSFVHKTAFPATPKSTLVFDKSTIDNLLIGASDPTKKYLLDGPNLTLKISSIDHKYGENARSYSEIELCLDGLATNDLKMHRIEISLNTKMVVDGHI